MENKLHPQRRKCRREDGYLPVRVIGQVKQLIVFPALEQDHLRGVASLPPLIESEVPDQNAVIRNCSRGDCGAYRGEQAAVECYCVSRPMLQRGRARSIDVVVREEIPQPVK